MNLRCAARSFIIYEFVIRMAVLTRLSVKTTGATLRDKALLPHDSLKASVAPQAIGWISTISAAGVANVVPYSFFNKLF